MALVRAAAVVGGSISSIGSTTRQRGRRRTASGGGAHVFHTCAHVRALFFTSAAGAAATATDDARVN